MRAALPWAAARPLVATACLLLASMTVMAQSGGADLSMEIASTGVQVTQTQIPRLTFTITNKGPMGVLDAEIFGTVGIAAAGTILVVPQPGCPVSLSPDVSISRQARFSVGALAPLEQRVCSLTLQATAAAPRGSLNVIMRARSLTVPETFGNDNLKLLTLGYSSFDIRQDLALSIRSPLGVLVPGVVQPVDFTVTNNGPDFDPLFGPFVLSEVYQFGLISQEQWRVAPSGDPDCGYSVDDIGGLLGYDRTSQLDFAPIPPGQSRTCTLLVFSVPGPMPSRSVQFRLINDAPGILESNVADNMANLNFQFFFRAVPTMEAWGRVTLCVGLLLLAVGWYRRSRKPVTTTDRWY